MAVLRWRSCGLVLCVLLAARAGDQKFDEYQVKAAFICNFPNFIDWPPSAFRTPSDPFSVCVLGHNPFGRALETLAEGRMVDGHGFLVRQISEVRRVSGCHILYISSSERLRYRAILQGLENSSVLTVGDTNEFIAEGGIVSMRLEGGKVRVEINAQAAKEKNLRISSRLLQLAKGSR